MRTTAALLSLVICVMTGVSLARAGDAETIAAINAASAALDDAFERQDADDIKRMMTSDHVAVTPYYDGPQSLAAQIASLPELKFEQTIIGEAKVEVLAPGVGLRTFEAKLDGTFKGKPIPTRAFITSIMTRDGGAWRERFYQMTAMQP